MTYRFMLPDIGEGIAEAEIAAWHVGVGDKVSEDQLLVDLMTDKATVEMTSPVAGTVLSIHGDVGQMVPVGALLVEIQLEEDEEKTPAGGVAEAAAAAEAADIGAAAGETTPKAAAQPAANAAPASPAEEPVVLASPAVRKAAHERDIPLQFVKGSGPGGRVLMEDLNRQQAAAATGKTAEAADEITERQIVGLRRRIAEKMQESKRQIPHFGYVEEFDLTELEALRADLNASRSEREPRLTLLPFFIRAVVSLAGAFEHINARYDDAEGILRMHSGVHAGIATQTAGGLMVPVIRHAERLDIWECAEELSRVTEAARNGTARREELSGSTITLTSLGALGGIVATPIINYPEVAIIGPNKLVERPVVIDGRIVIRRMMNVSSSFDHRIVDGHDAARFIQSMKRLIEHPSLLFVERRT
ncbi:MAG: 2-oxo acid dehydrogenase subunit E2 [Rhizobiales bacterium]|nr:2-oxo acid dehydrogenase subunit E2 [Hyphomicrobiales bacterium]